MLSKSYFLYLLVALGIFENIRAQSPNIILVIADDMGWAQTSAGSLNMNNVSDFFETPVIKQLAEEGIAFPNGYVNGANCAPTRAAILSGQWASRTSNNVFGVEDLNRGNNNSLLVGPDQGIVVDNGKRDDQIQGSTITIADALKSLGYTTAHFGKYHVGGGIDSGSVNDNTPREHGFDYNYGGGTSGTPGSYFSKKQDDDSWEFGGRIGPELDPYANPYTAAESLELAGDNSLEGTAKHVTDAMVDAAIDFIDNEDSNPFFIHYSNFAIHGPYGVEQARPDFRAKYEEKNETTPSQIGHAQAGQAAIAEGMDQALGRLVDYLKTSDDPRNPGQKLSENTLVYFVSDNGGADSPADNIPLKSMKGSYYEGGIRSLTFVWSEAPFLANKGTINTTPVVAFDTFPTFVEMAGGNPTDYSIDGVSQWSMLNGSNTNLGRESLYWHFPGYLIDNKRDQRPVSVIRRGDHKLIYNYETGTYELYDLINDISESNDLLDDLGNVSNGDQFIAAQLSTDLVQYLKDVDAPLPTYRSNGQQVDMPTPIFEEALDVTDIPKLELEIILSPNPFYNKFELVIPNGGETTVEIYNALGQSFFTKKYTTNEITILENEVKLSAGEYFVKVSNGSASVVETLIKK